MKLIFAILLCEVDTAWLLSRFTLEVNFDLLVWRFSSKSFILINGSSLYFIMSKRKLKIKIKNENQYNLKVFVYNLLFYTTYGILLNMSENGVFVSSWLFIALNNDFCIILFILINLFHKDFYF